MTLAEYLLTRRPKGFKPLPRLNVDGGLIEWWWADRAAVSESVRHDGEWVGTLHRDKDGNVVGVSVHLEAVRGGLCLLEALCPEPPNAQPG